MGLEACDFRRALEIVGELGVDDRGRRRRPTEPKGAKPPKPAKPAVRHSPVASSDCAGWRESAWEAATREHLRRIARPCEPFDESAPLLLEKPG